MMMMMMITIMMMMMIIIIIIIIIIMYCNNNFSGKYWVGVGSKNPEYLGCRITDRSLYIMFCCKNVQLLYLVKLMLLPGERETRACL